MGIHLRLLRQGAALMGATAFAVGSVVAPSYADDIDGVPVVGQAEAVPSFNNDDGAREVVITLHSVRRVEDVTVVYWSAGFRADSEEGTAAHLVNSFGSSQAAGLFRERVYSDPMCNIGVPPCPPCRKTSTRSASPSRGEPLPMSRSRPGSWGRRSPTTSRSRSGQAGRLLIWKPPPGQTTKRRSTRSPNTP